ANYWLLPRPSPSLRACHSYVHSDSIAAASQGQSTRMNLRPLLERGNRPFPPHPQVGRYFPAASIEAARGRLARSIERGDGPGLVIGSAGTGKSLLLQVLAAQNRERFDVVL